MIKQQQSLYDRYKNTQKKSGRNKVIIGNTQHQVLEIRKKYLQNISNIDRKLSPVDKIERMSKRTTKMKYQDQQIQDKKYHEFLGKQHSEVQNYKFMDDTFQNGMDSARNYNKQREFQYKVNNIDNISKKIDGLLSYIKEQKYKQVEKMEQPSISLMLTNQLKTISEKQEPNSSLFSKRNQFYKETKQKQKQNWKEPMYGDEYRNNMSVMMNKSKNINELGKITKLKQKSYRLPQNYVKQDKIKQRQLSATKVKRKQSLLSYEQENRNQYYKKINSNNSNNNIKNNKNHDNQQKYHYRNNCGSKYSGTDKLFATRNNHERQRITPFELNHTQYQGISNQNQCMRINTYTPERIRKQQENYNIGRKNIHQNRSNYYQKYDIQGFNNVIQTNQIDAQILRVKEKLIQSQKNKTSLIKKFGDRNVKHTASFSIEDQQANNGKMVNYDQLMLKNQGKINKKHDFELKLIPVEISKKHIAYLGEILGQQVKQDQKLRDYRVKFEGIINNDKWTVLKKQLQTKGIYMNEQNIEQILKMSKDEHNPFSPKQSPGNMNDISNLAKQFAITEQFWNKQITKCVSRQNLKNDGFKVIDIDLQGKGYISVEDLVCFINLYTGHFYRNRDCLTLFKRFLKIQSENNEKEGLSYQTFMQKICGK